MHTCTSCYYLYNSEDVCEEVELWCCSVPTDVDHLERNFVAGEDQSSTLLIEEGLRGGRGGGGGAL